jgi:2-amino-4-hydroxy-6-hydroxymethyldihydropteridine diphosphokinase
MTATAYVGFGSNLGDRAATFEQALNKLARIPRTEVAAHSRLYETAPVGISDGGPMFVNAAIELKTDLSPHDLLSEMQRIELQLGKSPRHTSDRSRSIDLDMLLYDGESFEQEGLEVPHPRMHIRGFVLVPLAEIAPELVHPVLKKSMRKLCSSLPETELNEVRCYSSEHS